MGRQPRNVTNSKATIFAETEIEDRIVRADCKKKTLGIIEANFRLDCSYLEANIDWIANNMGSAWSYDNFKKTLCSSLFKK